MQSVTVERNVTPMKLEVLNVECWPDVTLEPSEFEVSYEVGESVFIARGRVLIKTAEDESITLKKGDLAHFPQGCTCTWLVEKTTQRFYLKEDA